MSAFSCDLHIHSCLSPCGDDEMTPGSIAGMAKLNGLSIAALTDHNACGNCAPFFAACEEYDVVPVAGMELTTSEDVHLLCLFRTLDSAMEFAAVVGKQRIRIKNRSEIFGRQILVGTDDVFAGEEQDLLVNATNLSLEEAARSVWKLGGAAVPAHIDREANGVIAVLGAADKREATDAELDAYLKEALKTLSLRDSAADAASTLGVARKRAYSRALELSRQSGLQIE